ncbi:TetR/AcrR family transcriptional regulator [Nonomuraea rhizosphaerae]|uniref:TetR/AcrR family transcriptional regulator n=1 Tax=Nonomuraea rhizosphaerae TaxID=2665663 RepID=UPI001C5ECCE7|nr:TetR/AcrR family transcriptional regulator [Nonomuraea rhizosphaerae]
MRKRLTRQTTIEGAIAYADEHGINALSISALARHLGVAAPSLYVHLPNGLKELRAALSVQGHLGLADRCRRAATGRSGADALRAIAHAEREYACAHPALYAATAFAVDDQEVRRAAEEAAAVTAEVLALGPLTAAVRAHVARGIRSAVHGFCALESAGVLVLRAPADESPRADDSLRTDDSPRADDGLRASVEDSFAWLVDALVTKAMETVAGATAAWESGPRST